MKKILKNILIGLFIYQAAFFTLVNHDSQTVVMTLKWVDHNFKNYPRPARMIVAQITPGNDFKGAENYPGRIFICEVIDPPEEVRLDNGLIPLVSKINDREVEWKQFKQFKIFDDVNRVICTWDSELIKLSEEAKK